MTIQISKHSITIDLLVITLLWCLAVAVVKPAGDFPLNDDWSYGLAVKRLIEDKVFHPTGWTAMPLLSQVLWGALFCLPCGFSFTALRFSTITLALFGILGLYLLIRGLGAYVASWSNSLKINYYWLWTQEMEISFDKQ